MKHPRDGREAGRWAVVFGWYGGGGVEIGVERRNGRGWEVAAVALATAPLRWPVEALGRFGEVALHWTERIGFMSKSRGSPKPPPA